MFSFVFTSSSGWWVVVYWEKIRYIFLLILPSSSGRNLIVKCRSQIRETKGTS